MPLITQPRYSSQGLVRPDGSVEGPLGNLFRALADAANSGASTANIAYIQAQIAALEAGQSPWRGHGVNGIDVHTDGSGGWRITLDATTDNVTEGLTNLYYTDARAKLACVADTITDAVTDVAPSQNAVFDALAGKETAGAAAAAQAAAQAFATAADTALLTATISNSDATHAPTGDAVFDALALKADLASPAFTGNPTGPTPSDGDTDTSLATTSFVSRAIGNRFPWTQASGAADVIVATFVPALLAYGDGQFVRVRPIYDNATTTPTLNANGLGALTIKSGGDPIAEGAIQALRDALLVLYDSGVSQWWEYLNPAATGLEFLPKPKVSYATAAALPSCTYANGSSGVGATLTGTANGPLLIDGVTLAVGALGERVMVGNQATGLQNGWYTITQVGVVAVSPFILTRTTQSDQAAEIGPGYLTAVEAPTGLTAGTNNGKVFVSIAPTPFVVGTNTVLFSAVGSAAVTPTGTGFTHITAGVQDAAAVTETGTGDVVRAIGPTLSNPIVGTQALLDNSTKAASTAYVDSTIVASGLSIGLSLQIPTLSTFL